MVGDRCKCVRVVSYIVLPICIASLPEISIMESEAMHCQSQFIPRWKKVRIGCWLHWFVVKVLHPSNIHDETR